MGRLPCVAGVRTRRARVAARRGIVLRDVGVTANTKSRYRTAVNSLLKFVGHVHSSDDLDEKTADWVESLFQQGCPLNTAADGLSGLHYFLPLTRKQIPSAWRLFSTWRKVETPARAAPFPADLLFAMVSYELQHLHFEMGSLLAVGFDCFLRTGEILNLCGNDILINDETGILTLTSSKGGVRHNVKESITILDPRVLSILRQIILLKRQAGLMNVPIWSASPAKFRERLQELVTIFHVQNFNFRGYSVRRGGATAFFAQCGLMERTLLRGRWASVQVAKLYLCDGLAQLPKLKASQTTRKLIASYLAFWSTC